MGSRSGGDSRPGAAKIEIVAGRSGLRVIVPPARTRRDAILAGFALAVAATGAIPIGILVFTAFPGEPWPPRLFLFGGAAVGYGLLVGKAIGILRGRRRPPEEARVTGS